MRAPDLGRRSPRSRGRRDGFPRRGVIQRFGEVRARDLGAEHARDRLDADVVEAQGAANLAVGAESGQASPLDLAASVCRGLWVDFAPLGQLSTPGPVRQHGRATRGCRRSAGVTGRALRSTQPERGPRVGTLACPRGAARGAAVAIEGKKEICSSNREKLFRANRRSDPPRRSRNLERLLQNQLLGVKYPDVWVAGTEVAIGKAREGRAYTLCVRLRE